MPEGASAFIGPWSNFYVMLGSAAAALTGLMFVVITLVKDQGRVRKSSDGISIFSTPTVVHFGAALMVSAILLMPWHRLAHPAALLGLLGAGSLTYVLRVTHRTTRISIYDPDLEDWMWYSVVPLVAYGAICAGGVLLTRAPVNALFAVGAGTAFLVFIGVRNAWDVVTYITVAPNDDEPPAS